MRTRRVWIGDGLGGRHVLKGILLCGAGALTACATAPQPVAAPGSATDLPWLARYVAEQLETAAEGDQARLAMVELEMRRISDALPAARMAAPDTAQPVETAEAQPAPAETMAETAPAESPRPASWPAAPQLAEGRSVFSALTLGAYPDADTARAAWFGMNAGHGEALAGLDARMEARMRDDGATVYVLKAGPFETAQEAETRCAALRAAGAVCQAGDFTGSAL